MEERRRLPKGLRKPKPIEEDRIDRTQPYGFFKGTLQLRVLNREEDYLIKDF
jgi:hypothetical protein